VKIHPDGREEDMKKNFLFLTAVFVCLVFSASGWAAASTIVGIWSVPIEAGKDKGKERSHIEIFEKNGLYYGKNVKLNNAPANLLCRKCKSEKKDQPILGMVVIRDLNPTTTHNAVPPMPLVFVSDERHKPDSFSSVSMRQAQ